MSEEIPLISDYKVIIAIMNLSGQVIKPNNDLPLISKNGFLVVEMDIEAELKLNDGTMIVESFIHSGNDSIVCVQIARDDHNQIDILSRESYANFNLTDEVHYAFIVFPLPICPAA